MKGALIFLVLFASISGSLSAKHVTSFTLQGTINAGKDGTITLLPVSYVSFYPFHINQEAHVVDGRFSFTDSISYPTAYKLGFKVDGKWQFVSDLFFVEPGVQAISCVIDSVNAPVISNRSTTEHQQYLEAMSNGADMEQFAQRHPDSYVVLWEMIAMLQYGYQPLFDSVFNHLSVSVKSSGTGKAFAEKMTAFRSISIGSMFPQLRLLDIQNSGINAPIVDKRNKYTLVDFWFTHCGPCIGQFPDYKRIYSIFNKKGFEMIGISTDAKNDAGLWKQMIKAKELDWPQYLDEDSKNADRLGIDFTPSNFLLDNNGVIIRRNISPRELERLLAQKL